MNAQIVPGCTGKVKHATEGGAIAAAARTGRRDGKRGDASTYHCRNCGCWHVSTLRGNRAKRDAMARAVRNRDTRPIWDRVHVPMPGAPFEWPGAKGPEDEA